MRLFDFFNKKKVELTEEQQKWNKLWEIWAQEKVESPYAELILYQSEINNGGHDQYFANMENAGDLQKEISALETILSEKFNANLKNAYKAYLVLKEKEEDEEAEITLIQCDDVFFENEEEINHVLKEYASKIEL